MRFMTNTFQYTFVEHRGNNDKKKTITKACVLEAIGYLYLYVNIVNRR